MKIRQIFQLKVTAKVKGLNLKIGAEKQNGYSKKCKFTFYFKVKLLKFIC